MKRNLNWFLNSKERNAWIKEPGLQVYVRRTFYFSSKGKKKAFEIANVVASPQSKRTFTKFLTRVEQELRETEFELIHIENVIEKRFGNFFIKRDYKLIGMNNIVQCFEKELTK